MCLDTASARHAAHTSMGSGATGSSTVSDLEHLLGDRRCQVHSEDTYYGHLVLRLMGCLCFLYSRII